MHTVLPQHGQRAPVTDTFGRQGRAWLRQIDLPPVAREAVDTYSGLIDQVGQHIARQDARVSASIKIPKIAD